MSEYGNSQTWVDTQSGQHWRDMQKNMQDTFKGLQDANIESIKERKKKIEEEEKKRVLADAKQQAYTVEYQTDLKTAFPNMTPADFNKTFAASIDTVSKLKRKLDDGVLLTDAEKTAYASARGTAGLVKQAVANRIALLTDIADAKKLADGSPGSYSVLNLGSAVNKHFLDSMPTKDRKSIQPSFTISPDFSSVDIGIELDGASDLSATLKGGNLEYAMSDKGFGGFYEVVDVTKHLDNAKITSGLYVQEDTLKSGEAKGKAGSIDMKFLSKDAKTIYDKASNTYYKKFVLSKEGDTKLRDAITYELSGWSDEDKLTFGADKLRDPTINANTLADLDAKAKLEKAIFDHMYDVAPKEQLEIDEVATNVKRYEGPKKGNKNPPLTERQKIIKAYRKANPDVSEDLAVATLTQLKKI
jgi:hypothetical protein